jgi:acetyltransferase-like isoleucine patch superfamily enzyme
MIHANIKAGRQVEVDDTASLNNADLGHRVRVGQRTTIFGSPRNVLKVGTDTRIGHHSILNGYAAQLSIGERCSIGSFCHFIVDTGPTASEGMLKRFPIKEAPISIGNDCLIGHGTMVIAGVTIGDGVFVHPKSFVNSDIPPFSIAGGCPAKVLGKVGEYEGQI